MERLLNLIHKYLRQWKKTLNPTNIKISRDSWTSIVQQGQSLESRSSVNVDPEIKNAEWLFLVVSCGLVILEGLAKTVP